MHVVTHIKDEFKPFKKGYFKSTLKHCHKCAKNIQSCASFHMFHKHNILHDEVISMVDGIMQSTATNLKKMEPTNVTMMENSEIEDYNTQEYYDKNVNTIDQHYETAQSFDVLEENVDADDVDSLLFNEYNNYGESLVYNEWGRFSV